MTQFNRSTSFNIGPVAGQGVKVQNLRINFNIKKTNNKEPNIGSIKVYNLSQSTREQLDKNIESENKNKIYLSAGYLDSEGEKLLFVGDVNKIEHMKENADVITMISAQDGARNLNTVKASVSFKKDASAKEILETLLKLYPISNDLKNTAIKDIRLKQGFSFGGLASEGIKKITTLLGLDFSIQNDELRIIPLDGNNSTSVVSLTSKSGLIRSPTRINDETEKSLGKSKKTNPGWRFISLLQPLIIPGGRVQAESRDIPKSVFTVVSVEHKGDNFIGEFQTLTDVKDAA